MGRFHLGPLILAALLAGGCDDRGGPQTAANDTGNPMQKTVQVKVFNDRGEVVGPVSSPRVVKTDAEWKTLLTGQQYEIARAKGTEAPFCGNLLDNHRDGVYVCVCCGLPL